MSVIEIFVLTHADSAGGGFVLLSSGGEGLERPRDGRETAADRDSPVRIARHPVAEIDPRRFPATTLSG